MSEPLTITVHGQPAPQGSKRHVGGGRMVESSKHVAPWREAVRTETQRAIAALPDGGCGSGFGAEAHGPVTVTLRFRLLRPQSHFGAKGLRPSAPAWPAKIPDLDKLIRSSLDGVVMGGAIADDKQVCGITATKEWCTGSEMPGATITIRTAGGPR